MRKVYLGMMVMALVALPALASAQETPRQERREEARAGMRMGMGGMMFANPAEMILRRQADLHLTPEQLEKLGKIRDHFAHENAEDLAKAQKEWDEMRAKFGAPPYSDETREKMRHDREEAQKKYAKLFENSRKAREEAMEVLSADQKTQLREEMRGRMGGGPGMMQHR